MLAMCHSWHEVAFGCPVARTLVRDQNAGRIAQSFEQRSEKALRRMPVAPALYQDVESLAVLSTARQRS